MLQRILPNMQKILNSVSVLVLGLICCTKCQDFGYDGDIGPTHWGESYNTCTGKHQSPINIDLLSVQRVSLPPLQFHGFDKIPQETSLTNNGHTVMVNMDSEKQPTIRGGPLEGTYEFSQFHFHWGDNDTFGSEDLINGRSFPMEIHLVFFKKNYRNVRSALNHTDGLAVLAFFYEVDDVDNPSYLEFTKLLSHVHQTNEKAEFNKPPTIYDLVGERDLDSYFTYNGSLTTPPCSEVVTWIDFATPIPLSHDQIESFRDLQDSHGHKLTHNFRPPQPLNERVVLYNTPTENKEKTQFMDEVPIEKDDVLDNVDHKHKLVSTTVLSNNIDEMPQEFTTAKSKTHKKDPERLKGSASQLYRTPWAALLILVAIALFHKLV